MSIKRIDSDLAEEIIDRNVRAVERIATEMFGKGRLDLADDLVWPDYVEHGTVPPDWPTGVAGLVGYVEMLRRAFPELQAEIINAFGHGDRAFVHVAYSGKHQGEIFDIPASGRAVRWEEMHLCRMVDGRMAEHWETADLLGLMQQITPASAAN